MSQPDCESIVQTLQSLTRQMLELDDGIEELEAEALRQPLPSYFVLQQEVDHLFKRQRVLQNEWNNAMSDLAIRRSARHAYRYQEEGR